MTKSKKKEYSIKEKIEAILVLKENEFNYSKTAKQLNPHVNTLKSWYNNFGYKITQELDNNYQVQETVQEYAEQKNKFLNEVYDTKKETLDVLKRKVHYLSYEENLQKIDYRFFNSLIDVLKVLNDLEKNSDPQTVSDQKMAEEKSQRWQLIQNQIINEKH